MRAPAVIKDNETLSIHYDSLGPETIICTRLRLSPGEEHLLLDLASRGVKSIPSYISQLCSRSKAFQTRLFSTYMVPGTCVIYTIHDLLKTIPRYGTDGITKVVLKQEGKNGGLGVFLFNSIEDVYTQTATGIHPFPFVIQPYISDFRDLRVIILDDYLEVYQRVNKGSFRHNLHCGGSPVKCELTDEQRSLCREVMQRGAFPYAHIDLMETDDNRTYLTEINLRGGLRGAAINSRDYHEKIEQIHDTLCKKLQKEMGVE